MSDISVSVRGLYKTFSGNAPAVNAIDFDVRKGEVLGLLGPSGCGKTTTLRCLAGLEQPDGGVIELGGRIVSAPGTNVKVEHRHIGMVFQSYALWPHMTVGKNIEFALDYGEVKHADKATKVRQALEAVDLIGFSERYPSELSGGQQQRVAVARAIAAEPKVVLFDEPLSNLDARLRTRVRLELRVLLKRLGITAVYVTHDQGEALALCDKIAVMSAGEISQLDRPEVVFRRPANAFVASFLSDADLVPYEHEIGGPNGESFTLGDVAMDAFAGAVPPEYRGTSGQLAVRPECSSIGAASSNELGWRGVVVGRIFLGAFTEYLVQIDGTTRQLRVTSPKASLDVGEQCSVVPDLSQVVWLPDQAASPQPSRIRQGSGAGHGSPVPLRKPAVV